MSTQSVPGAVATVSQSTPPSSLSSSNRVATAPGTDVMKQAPPSVSARLTVSALSDMRLKGGAMDTIYIGVDLVAKRQSK